MLLHKGVFMRTTLDIPDETFRQLKAQAALNGMKLKELVTQLIQRGLAADAMPPRAAQPPAPTPEAMASVTTAPVAAAPGTSYPIPIAREADGTVTPYLSNAALHAMLEEQDLAQYQRALNGAGGQ